MALAAVVAAGTAGAATGPIKPATMTPIKIGVTGLGINLYWDLMVADQVGFFRQNNLNPSFVTISTPGTLTAAAASGSVDFVAVATDAIIGAIDQGGALKIVAGEALGSFSLVSKASISNFAALKGKKVGIADPNSGSTLLLLALLKKNGLSRDDVQFVPAAATSQRFAALQAGAVDAALLSQPADFAAEDAGFKILGNTASALRRYQITAHAVNENFARSNRPAVVAFVRAIRNAQQWLWNPVHKNQAIDIFGKTAKVSPSVAQRAYKMMFEDLKTMSVNAQIEPTAINNVLKAMQQTVGGGPRTAGKYYDATFLAASLPAVSVQSLSARFAKGVIVARLTSTRAAKATLRVLRSGKAVGKPVTANLKAGKNTLGVRFPGGSRSKLTLVATVKDSAGHVVKKSVAVKA